MKLIQRRSDRFPVLRKERINLYGIPTSLLRFLGACVYGDPATYYGGLNEAKRAELDVQGRTFGMTAWLYRYLCNALPEEKRLAYQKIYQARQVKALLSVRELIVSINSYTYHVKQNSPASKDRARKMYRTIREGIDSDD